MDDQEYCEDDGSGSLELPEHAFSIVESNLSSAPVALELEDEKGQEASQECQEKRDVEECAALFLPKHSSGGLQENSLDPDVVPVLAEAEQQDEEDDREHDSQRKLEPMGSWIDEEADGETKEDEEGGEEHELVHDLGAALDQDAVQDGHSEGDQHGQADHVNRVHEQIFAVQLCVLEQLVLEAFVGGQAERPNPSNVWLCIVVGDFESRSYTETAANIFSCITVELGITFLGAAGNANPAGLD